MGSASCSCARRSYTGTRRRQRRTFPFLRLTPPLRCVLGRMRTKAKLLLACRSTTAPGTQGRMKLRTASLIARPSLRAPTTTTTGAPSTTASMSQVWPTPPTTVAGTRGTFGGPRVIAKKHLLVVSLPARTFVRAPTAAAMSVPSRMLPEQRRRPPASRRDQQRRRLGLVSDVRTSI